MVICYLNTSILKFNPGHEDSTLGCDAVIIDLEDSVHAKDKQQARTALETLDLTSWAIKGKRFGVRINSLMSLDGIQDMCSMFARSQQYAGISFIQLPKVESRFEIELCRSVLTDFPYHLDIIPIIETPKGIECVEEIAKISDAMMFGRVDMAASMYRVNNAYLSYARGRFCIACAQYGISSIDTANFDVSADIKDIIAFEKDCEIAKSEGFTARAVVHPCQIPVVKRVFAMDSEEIDNYRATIAAYNNAETGFSVDNGKIIAPPFVARAKKMLSLCDDTTVTSK